MNIKPILLFLSLAIASCTSIPPADRLDNVPMYGQPFLSRAGAARQADEAFVAEAIARTGDRKQASVLWSDEADRYLRERNFIVAMRRYNQARLLDPESFRPYWGFARVTLERDQFDEALAHFERARDLCEDPYQRPALLTDAGAAYMWKADSLATTEISERQRYFGLANARFEESVALDPRYANAYVRWVRSLAKEGDFASAWKVVERGRSAGASFPDELMRSLRTSAP